MVARNDVVKRHSADRRRLEFRAIRAMVKRNREGFIRRLQGNVESQGGCVLWLGSIDRYGYGRMSVYYKKQRVLISVQRVFLILTLCRPIRVNHDAGHTNFCPHKHCVLHLFEQRSVENGREAQAKQHGDGVPF